MAALPLIAILRGVQPHEAVAIGQALNDAGWHMFEVPLNSPQPLQSIALLHKAFPHLLVGAGTVLRPEQVQEVHQAGGRLIVAPEFNAAVVRAALDLGMVCLPGVATPTEAFAALEAGATGLKLFPAEMIPPAAVKALRAVLPPGTALLPVGGIDASNIAAYVAAGASGFGVGSSLYKPGMAADEVRRNALALKDACTGTMRA
ncbi:2-dehydro-3-deoxy-6-phosphogalactonate aldolase [Ramlibacter tataouinensis]|uniref:2-dehydro-3-deoxy-6-phosphogalactonate aldolase n=1 Tax=Ramlibacter tataouinensis TaxID=94132 RepID=A0A127JWD6_9BURK|nr:2-dehydro-3-deoxy-6-phosphogalactonate aldolase [Ramlibacter tataouinensis]AMO24307.1 2-dehydro-3-deoxy-6-phosphogalactonate aldolase [Ramlibacter tataouinensis]